MRACLQPQVGGIVRPQGQAKKPSQSLATPVKGQQALWLAAPQKERIKPRGVCQVSAGFEGCKAFPAC
ncbi:hypothetical protein WJX74_009718 [Apatococcus lobatus]|uniref:Uncharacterized protein n=1 Tax=Apatococcus lobatus TaxID=904363 RepID=A0AAW1RM31_9CHLO